MPSVQNDMRVRWYNGRRNQFIKECSYKLPDMNRSCSMLNKFNVHSINQKTMHTALIITSEHSTRPLFGWFLKSEYLHSSQYASHPVILRGAARRSRRIHHPKNNSRPPGGEERSQTVGEGHRMVTPDDQTLLHKHRIEPSHYSHLILRLLHQCCHSAWSQRRSRRIHHPKNIPRPPGEGGPSQTMGGDRGRVPSEPLT